MADQMYLGQPVPEERKSSGSRFVEALRGLGAGLAVAGGNYAPMQQMQAEEAQRKKDAMLQQAQARETEKYGTEKKLSELKLKKLQRELDTPIGGINPAEKRKIETGIRKEVSPYVKRFQGIDAAYGKVKKAAEKPSAAGDLSLIFNYMKLLDPGSVVREGEFANAQNAAGVPDRVRNLYNRAMEGTRLGKAQRADFVNSSERVYGAELDSYNTALSGYRDLAEREGLNFKNINIYRPKAIETEAQKEKKLANAPLPFPMGMQEQAVAQNKKHEEAIAWAKANPRDPDAQEILNFHGIKMLAKTPGGTNGI